MFASFELIQVQPTSKAQEIDFLLIYKWEWELKPLKIAMQISLPHILYSTLEFFPSCCTEASSEEIASENCEIFGLGIESNRIDMEHLKSGFDRFLMWPFAVRILEMKSHYIRNIRSKWKHQTKISLFGIDWLIEFRHGLKTPVNKKSTFVSGCLNNMNLICSMSSEKRKHVAHLICFVLVICPSRNRWNDLLRQRSEDQSIKSCISFDFATYAAFHEIESNSENLCIEEKRNGGVRKAWLRTECCYKIQFRK